MIETDHTKPLALLKNKQIDVLPPRIQRFRMRLMRYILMIFSTHHLVTTDTLSRSPVSVPGQADRLLESETNMIIHLVLENMPATEPRLEQIRTKPAEDRITQSLQNRILTSAHSGL